jgi:hypothetical protein
VTVTPELLEDLVDDAGLFPPARLPMDAALARHAADEWAETPGRSMLTHRFLCPASRLGELRAAPGVRNWPSGPEVLGMTDRPGMRLRVGLILDTGVDGLPAALAELAAEPHCELQAIEVPAPSEEAVSEALGALAAVDVPVFVEGPREPGWLEALGQWAGPALRGAKVRCGGARAELFPSPEELAAFVHACWARTVPFKATAGLHRAVRSIDEGDGLVHHGFLNLVVAGAFAVRGETERGIAAVLAATDPGRLVDWAREVSPGNAKLARSLLVAYGSCSTSEPRDEAAALGLLGDPGA